MGKPQDHFVAETYLRAFLDPNRPTVLNAYAKADDARHFTPTPDAICKRLNWDETPRFLSPPSTLGDWLKMYEPHWAGAVERLGKDHQLSSIDKLLLAGYWAYLSICNPAWQRAAVATQQQRLEDFYLQRFVAHVLANPTDFPSAADYLPKLQAGILKPDDGYYEVVQSRALPARK